MNNPRFPRSGRLDLIASRLIAAGAAAPSTGNPESLVILDAGQFATLLSAMLGQVNVKHKSVTLVAGTPTLVLPKDDWRAYLFIQNQDPNNNIYYGVDCWATPNDGLMIPGNAARPGYYEPYRVPTGDIYLISGAASQVFILYGVPHILSD